MNRQRSFGESKGLLYLVPTPIGNLEDITLRALRILNEVDVIAAEDTRNAKKILNHFEIRKNVVSYHEHNKKQSGKQLLEWIKSGQNVALVSDAGMPAISDPGYELIEEAIHNHIPVISLPGPNAALTALVASGLNPQPFYFYGFLPRKPKERDEQLHSLRDLRAAIIFYEAPHRIRETVDSILKVLGNRQIVLARELTKRFEEYVRGTVEEIVEWLAENEPRGEFCLIVEGAKEDNKSGEWWASLSVEEQVILYIEQGLSAKEAIKQTALDRKIPKREVYQIYHVKDKK